MQRVEEGIAMARNSDIARCTGQGGSLKMPGSAPEDRYRVTLGNYDREPNSRNLKFAYNRTNGGPQSFGDGDASGSSRLLGGRRRRRWLCRGGFRGVWVSARLPSVKLS